MGVFSNIRDAIFGPKDSDPASRPQIPAGWAGGPPLGTPGAAQAPTLDRPAATGTDVEQVLTDRLREKGHPDLNWRSSIVDLMKLLDIDSSLEHRKELATELGYSGEKNGSAEMNIWLHREVMRLLAASGGKVPPGLID